MEKTLVKRFSAYGHKKILEQDAHRIWHDFCEKIRVQIKEDLSAHEVHIELNWDDTRSPAQGKAKIDIQQEATRFIHVEIIFDIAGSAKRSAKATIIKEDNTLKTFGFECPGEDKIATVILFLVEKTVEKIKKFILKK